MSYDETKQFCVNVPSSGKPGIPYNEQSAEQKNLKCVLSWEEVDDEGHAKQCQETFIKPDALDDYISRLVNECNDADNSRPFISWLEKVLTVMWSLNPNEQ